MSAAFRSGAVRVRVPATSANLGPGFDALGLALGLYDDVTADVVDGDGLRIEISGEGAGLPRDETHLVLRAMRATFARLGGQPDRIALSCHNRIPHGRGLGSSAAAIVAGTLLARALVDGGDAALPDEVALAHAAELEGHPDNVAACLFGGLTVAFTQDGQAGAVRTDVSAELRPVVLVPPFESSTASARALLPADIPHRDAAFAAGRSALLVAVVSGAGPASAAALLAATEDRLHQSYRASAVPRSVELIDALRGRGVAAVLSGAGPTVLALTRAQDEVQQVLDQTPAGWSGRELAVATEGAQVVLADPMRTGRE